MDDIVPKKKPYTEESFKKDADLYIKGYLGGFPKPEMKAKLENSIKKIQESGIMSSAEAMDFVIERASTLKEFIRNNPGETLPQMKAYGGRINFELGGDTKYQSMVTRMYILSGGQEATGLTIEQFANQYFPRDNRAYGGRMGFKDGTMTKSEKWMRDYFFSGKGGYDDRMSYKEFALGPGQELYKKFGNN